MGEEECNCLVVGRHCDDMKSMSVGLWMLNRDGVWFKTEKLRKIIILSS